VITEHVLSVDYVLLTFDLLYMLVHHNFHIHLQAFYSMSEI
jgi:hypothetical protein